MAKTASTRSSKKNAGAIATGSAHAALLELFCDEVTDVTNFSAKIAESGINYQSSEEEV